MHFLHLYSIKNILFVNALDYLTNDNNYSFSTLLLYARIKLKTLFVKITCVITTKCLEKSELQHTTHFNPILIFYVYYLLFSHYKKYMILFYI